MLREKYANYFHADDLKSSTCSISPIVPYINAPDAAIQTAGNLISKGFSILYFSQKAPKTG